MLSYLTIPLYYQIFYLINITIFNSFIFLLPVAVHYLISYHVIRLINLVLFYNDFVVFTTILTI